MTEDSRVDAACLDSGAYVFGALQPAEQATFVQHAQTCQPCQHEIGLFAGLLPLLDHHDPADPMQRTDPPAGTWPTDLGTTVLCTSHPRGRTRLALALLAAAAVMLAAFLGPARTGGPSPAADRVRTATTPSVSSSEEAVVRAFPGLGTATVQVSVVTSTAGSSVTVLCSGAVQSAVHTEATAALVSLWVRTRSGEQFEVTAWTDMQGSTTIAGRTPVAPADIAMFELRGSDGKTLSHIAA